MNRKHRKLPKISPVYSVKFCFTAVLWTILWAWTTMRANSSLHPFHPVSLEIDFGSQPPMVWNHTGKWMWKPSKLKCIEEPCRWKATMLMLSARVDPKVLPVSSWGTCTVKIGKCKTKQGAEPSSLASGAACKDLWNLLAFCWICWVWCIFIWIGWAGCGRCGIRFASAVETGAKQRSVATPWKRRNVSFQKSIEWFTTKQETPSVPNHGIFELLHATMHQFLLRFLSKYSSNWDAQQEAQILSSAYKVTYSSHCCLFLKRSSSDVQFLSILIGGISRSWHKMSLGGKWLSKKMIHAPQTKAMLSLGKANIAQTHTRIWRSILSASKQNYIERHFSHEFHSCSNDTKPAWALASRWLFESLPSVPTECWEPLAEEGGPPMTMDGDPATGQLDSPPTAKFNSKKKRSTCTLTLCTILGSWSCQNKETVPWSFFQKNGNNE